MIARWRPRPEWGCETAFVLGGGPSLAGFNFGSLLGRRVIVVNSAGYDASRADILIFQDEQWLLRNYDLVSSWPGRAVTTSIATKMSAPKNVDLLDVERRRRFTVGGIVRMGRSSGHTAVSLAISLGASRVVLLGFDCRVVDGRSHYHDRYQTLKQDLYSDVFLPAWSGWNSDANAVGAQILNATPGSSITEFPMVDINDILREPGS